MTKEQAELIFEKVLSTFALDVVQQLFVQGPTWDGNIASKNGRDELCDKGFAFHSNGWTSLTAEGVSFAINAPVKNWRGQRWYRKQQCL